MKAKRRLSNFDFTGDNAAVSLVHKDQGGAANGYTTLITKSADVSVELTMTEFLCTFFNLWEGDARFIANLLGYSTEFETWSYEQLEEKVTLLKNSVKPSEEESEYRFPLDMGDLSELTSKELRELTKSLASASNVTIKDLEEVFKNADGVSEEPVSPKVETPVKEIEDMSEMIEKSVMEEALAEAIQKATENAEQKVKGEMDEIVKSLSTELEAFKAEKAEKEKAEYVEKAKAFEALGVEDFEAFGVALKKMAESEDFAVVSEALEKALNIAKNADALEEQGHDLDTAGNEVTGVSKALEFRKKSK